MEGGDDQRIGNKRRERDEKEEGKMGRLEKRPSGMIVMEEYSYNGDEMINGVKYEEEKQNNTTPTAAATTTGGGLFNQFITNLVGSPKSNQKGEGDEDQDEAADINNGDSGESEGVLKHLISNMFSGNGGEEVDGGGSEKEDDGIGGGSIIDNIVAQLPRTLSEDRVPATDEASILIHSIIHD